MVCIGATFNQPDIVAFIDEIALLLRGVITGKLELVIPLQMNGNVFCYCQRSAKKQ
jgi:hypothetical protein